jgi:hypothetical protein
MSIKRLIKINKYALSPISEPIDNYANSILYYLPIPDNINLIDRFRLLLCDTDDDKLKILEPYYKKNKSHHLAEYKKQHSNGYHTDISGYHTDISGYHTDKSNYQTDKSSYHTDKSSYQSDRSGYQTDKSSYQTDKSNYQTDKSSYQSDRSGYLADNSNNESEYNNEYIYIDKTNNRNVNLDESGNIILKEDKTTSTTDLDNVMSGNINNNNINTNVWLV